MRPHSDAGVPTVSRSFVRCLLTLLLTFARLVRGITRSLRDGPLVDAYLARRALDYLVGFTLSPVLWRKLPGSRSAGRVQSVALRIICDRELEIEAFKRQEYWTIDGTFTTPQGQEFSATLQAIAGRNHQRR